MTDYSNYGDRLDVVAPSSHDGTHVYSTDVATPNWGFNTTTSGDDGLFWNEFAETSAAAAMAAGVAALCLSANPNSTAAQVRSLLQDTADEVGVDEDGNAIEYDSQTGRSEEFGYGCIDAAEAVETGQGNAYLLSDARANSSATTRSSGPRRFRAGASRHG